MTPAEAQAEIRSIAENLLLIEDRLRNVWENIPRSPNEEAIHEGRQAWNVATELRATVECLIEGAIRPAIESLERASQANDDDLLREFRAGTN